MTGPDVTINQDLRRLLQDPLNLSGVQELKRLIEKRLSAAQSNAEVRGDTDFEKGQCHAYRMMIKTISNIASGTETA